MDKRLAMDGRPTQQLVSEADYAWLVTRLSLLWLVLAFILMLSNMAIIRYGYTPRGLRHRRCWSQERFCNVLCMALHYQMYHTSGNSSWIYGPRPSVLTALGQDMEDEAAGTPEERRDQAENKARHSPQDDSTPYPGPSEGGDIDCTGDDADCTGDSDGHPMGGPAQHSWDKGDGGHSLGPQSSIPRPVTWGPNREPRGRRLPVSPVSPVTCAPVPSLPGNTLYAEMPASQPRSEWVGTEDRRPSADLHGPGLSADLGAAEPGQVMHPPLSCTETPASLVLAGWTFGDSEVVGAEPSTLDLDAPPWPRWTVISRNRVPGAFFYCLSRRAATHVHGLQIQVPRAEATLTLACEGLIVRAQQETRPVTVEFAIHVLKADGRRQPLPQMQVQVLVPGYQQMCRMPGTTVRLRDLAQGDVVRLVARWPGPGKGDDEPRCLFSVRAWYIQGDVVPW